LRGRGGEKGKEKEERGRKKEGKGKELPFQNVCVRACIYFSQVEDGRGA